MKAIPIQYREIPYHTMESLQEYVLHGRAVGGFLEAVLTNDLFGAVGRADELHIKALVTICKFLYNCCPSICFGSKEEYREYKGVKDHDFVRGLGQSYMPEPGGYY